MIWPCSAGPSGQSELDIFVTCFTPTLPPVVTHSYCIRGVLPAAVKGLPPYSMNAVCVAALPKQNPPLPRKSLDYDLRHTGVFQTVRVNQDHDLSLIHI